MFYSLLYFLQAHIKSVEKSLNKMKVGSGEYHDYLIAICVFIHRFFSILLGAPPLVVQTEAATPDTIVPAAGEKGAKMTSQKKRTINEVHGGLICLIVNFLNCQLNSCINFEGGDGGTSTGTAPIPANKRPNNAAENTGIFGNINLHVILHMFPDNFRVLKILLLRLLLETRKTFKA